MTIEQKEKEIIANAKNSWNIHDLHNCLDEYKKLIINETINEVYEMITDLEYRDTYTEERDLYILDRLLSIKERQYEN